MKLYSYWRSSASYRVRIALALKGLKADILPVNLLKGEQRQEAYKAVNPLMRVPSLALDDGRVLTQSLAIIEYLDEVYPQVPLLPQVPHERAYVRELALLVSTDIAPLNNSGTVQYLAAQHGLTEEQKRQWMHHWMHTGFAAMETLLATGGYGGRCCFGSGPTMADCALVPQLYNARRFGVDLTPYPLLAAIDDYCRGLSAFRAAHPDVQPDAQ